MQNLCFDLTPVIFKLRIVHYSLTLIIGSCLTPKRRILLLVFILNNNNNNNSNNNNNNNNNSNSNSNSNGNSNRLNNNNNNNNNKINLIYFKLSVKIHTLKKPNKEL